MAALTQIESLVRPSPSVLSQRGGVELVEGLAEEWRGLCEEGASNEPFVRPEWIAACVNAFAPGGKLLLLTIREANRLRAVLPLLVEKTRVYGVPCRLLRSATNLDHSCRFDLAHGANCDPDAIAALLWAHLKALADWDAIELTNVREGAAVERLLPLAQSDGCPVAQHEFIRSPRLRLDRFPREGDFAKFAASAKLRSNLRRRWRRLQELGPVMLRRVERADARSLQQFYELEQRGWKGRAGTAIACSMATREFYDRLARAAGHFGYFTLHFLEVAGSAIAARFGLTLRRKYYPLKLAYDEAYSEYGPGHLMVGLILQDAQERGVVECDWVGHQEEWKAQWTTESRAHNYCSIFRNNMAGRVRRWDTTLRHNVWSTTRKIGRPLRVILRRARGKQAERSAAGS